VNDETQRRRAVAHVPLVVQAGIPEVSATTRTSKDPKVGSRRISGHHDTCAGESSSS
jgi:hypothetical protein